jgi:hypothetical protein
VSGRRWLAPLALLLVVAGARAVLVALFASPTPFWDQWDAEGAYLLAPWLDGALPASRLVEAHNEHRVLWTRLLTLGLFEANGGQWDNLVAAFANTVLAGALFAGLYAALRDGLAGRAARIALFVVLALLGTLPFGWENLPTGFQSQFFLLLLAALATIGFAARVREAVVPLLALWLLALGSLFTMATGLLAVAVAGGVLLSRAWLRQLSPRFALAGTAALAVPAVVALLAVPAIAGHQPLQAQDAGEWLSALERLLRWPLPFPAAGLLLWLPAAWCAWRVVRTRAADAATLTALGFAAWALLQAAAMAYSRGHGLLSPSSRYTDVLALGVVANAWFALRALDDRRAAAASAMPQDANTPHRLVVALLVSAPLLAGGALVRQAPADLGALRLHSRLAQVQSGNVRAFVRDGDPARLDVGTFEIPYPDAARLRKLLEQPGLRAALPWNLVDPRTDGAPAAGPLSAAAIAVQRAVRRVAGVDEIGHRVDERAAPVATGDGAAEPLWLADAAIVNARFRAPQSGELRRLGVQVATGGRALDGALAVRVCTTPDACVLGSASLAGARDNEDLLVEFAEPLPLAAGKGARIRIVADVGAAPVALWLYPAAAPLPPLRVRDADGERKLPQRMPRLTLGLQR